MDGVFVKIRGLRHYLLLVGDILVPDGLDLPEPSVRHVGATMALPEGAPALGSPDTAPNRVECPAVPA